MTDTKKNKKGQGGTTQTGARKTIRNIKEDTTKIETTHKPIEDIENKTTKENNTKQDTSKEKDRTTKTGTRETITKKKAQPYLHHARNKRKTGHKSLLKKRTSSGFRATRK